MNLKLRSYREARGLTQQSLAKAIGKSFRTIQSWERGESYPNAEAICLMCDFFKTDPNTFLGWWDDHERPKGMQLSHDEEVLLSDYRECTTDFRGALAKTARSFRDSSQALEADGASYEEGAA